MPAAEPKATYSAGTAYITVTPSFRNVEKDFRKQVAKMAAAADKDVAAAIQRGLEEASGTSKKSGEKAGRAYAGAYEREAHQALEKAWRTLPEPQPDVKLKKWDKALAAMRQDLLELSEQRIGIDIDRETFDRAVADARRKLEALRDSARGPNREIGFFNADSAARQLAALEEFTAEAARRAAGGGEKAGSAFTDRMAQALRDGISKIPEIRIKADSSEAERRIAAVRDRMVSLQSQRIGIDVDAAAAFAELRALAAELQALDRRSVRVDIRTNAHEASAGLASFIQQADGASSSTEGIGRSANFSMSRLEYLIALGASLGTAIIPGAAAAAGAVATIGTMAIAAAAGLGVFGLAVSGVGDAVKALSGVQKEQAAGADASSEANQRVVSSTNQVRMAQLALANTRRSVAEGAADAARRVADAEQGVVDARRAAGLAARNAAREVVDARKAVGEAEEDLAAARRQVRLDLAEANRQVRDAQRDVVDAERDAVQVREDLNEAIRDARRSMEELSVELSRNELDQQKAVTAQMQALEKLNKLKMNPRATQVELRQAQDAYDEQTQRLKELGLAHKQMSQQKAEYDRKGVEADEKVIAARKRIAEADRKVADARERLDREREQRQQAQYRAAERIADAQDRVAKAQEGVARAQENAREAEIRGQQRIAAAQRQVDDARRAQTRQALDGQYQIEQATNSLTTAQRSQAEAWDKVGGSGSAAMKKLDQAMAELSPEQQDFAKFIFSLKDELDSLQDAAAGPLLPQLETAITGLLPYLPGIEKFVGKIAGAMGDLAVKSVEALGSPVWQNFFEYIDGNAVPSMEQLWETGRNVTEGLISLFMALTPFNDEVGAGLVEMSRDFAMWAERLTKSQGYLEFLQYVEENGPRVVHFLGEMGHLLIRLVEAAAPMGAVVLQALTLLADGLNSLPDSALTALVVGIGAVSLGLTVLGARMRYLRLKEQLVDIFGPRMANMVQTYAIETGRATEQTSAFGRATAATQGYLAGVPARMQAATTGTGLFGRAMDSARVFMLDAAAAVSGPGGIAAGVQQLGTRMGLLNRETTATADPNGGMSRFKTLMMETQLAMGTAETRMAGFAAAAATVGREAGRAATGGVAKLAAGATNAATAVGTKLAGGMSTLAGVVGGGFNLALLGATTAITVLAAASADYNGKISTLASTLGNLSDQYKELDKAGKIGTGEATKLLTDIAQSNPEIRQAVVNLDSLGVSMDDLGRAAAGSKQDVDTVLKSLDDEIKILEERWKDQSNFLFTIFSDEAMATSDRLEQMRQLREALQKHGDEAAKAAEVQRILNGEDERAAAITGIKTAAAGRSLAVQSDLVGVYDKNADRIEVLNGLVQAFGTEEATAAQKADALRAAIENQTGAVVNAIEADERYASTLIGLRDQINNAKEAGDKHAVSLSLNTTTGLRNRDALQAVAAATREMYLQDIAAGKPIAEVTRKHQDRIEALIREADKLGLAEQESRALIKAYGDIDPKLETVYTTKNFDDVYEELRQLKFIQNALAQGWSVEKAREVWEADKWDQGLRNRKPQGRAEGGPITGPGTKTSDDVLLWGSDGEFMQRAAAVDYYGQPFMEAINNLEIPKDWLLGYAFGGLIGAQPTAKPKEIPGYAAGGMVNVPMAVNVAKTKIMSFEDMVDAAYGTAALGAGGGGQGWRWQMAVLRQQFPGLELYSGYRPGSITSSGNRSWHGIDGGRAVDVPPRRDVFNFIHDRYGKNTKELIWGGDPDRNIQRGKHHRYSDALLRAHGPYQGQRGPSPHVHWAFDAGGWLPPGDSLVTNQTGAPEPVLTGQQWRDISELAMAARAAAGRGGNTYQFEFRDTTLDAAQLRAIQDREAILARDDRAR